MIKVKLTGLPIEIEKATEVLKETFDVLDITKDYKNRNSPYVRLYADVEVKRACRVCGCTQYNACPGGCYCYWAEYDLCSECATTN